jgi:dTDP-4-amino-4,6-dideoxygalactose transaminase
MSFEKLFQFEQSLAHYTGAPYVVVTDGCTHAIELCFRYLGVDKCSFTAHTYISIPQLMNQLDVKYELIDEPWRGEYQFYNTPVWDSARRLESGMYRAGQMQCLSFGHSKPLSVGKLGAILLDSQLAYEWLSCARSDGRDLRIEPWQNQIKMSQGYHYCPTLEVCEQAQQMLPKITPQSQLAVYPDCRKITIVP